MEFLKKHYEKIILSVVLLALAVASAALPMRVDAVHRSLQDVKDKLIRKRSKPMEPLDLTTNETVLARLARPPSLSLSGDHNLFNPVKWERTPAGGLKKLRAGEFGPGALRIVEITPLYLSIAYEGVSGSADNPRYRFTVERQTGARSTSGQRRMILAQPNQSSKNDPFVLREVKNLPERPLELVIELTDDKSLVAVTTNQPFRRVIGYMADLKYAPRMETDARVFDNQKVGDKLSLSKVNYKIVSIDEQQISIEDERTTKRYTIRKSS